MESFLEKKSAGETMPIEAWSDPSSHPAPWQIPCSSRVTPKMIQNHRLRTTACDSFRISALDFISAPP